MMRLGCTARRTQTAGCGHGPAGRAADARESAMPDAPRPSRLRRLVSAVAVVFALTGGGLVAPAVVAPTHTAAAQAAVYSSCTLSRCSAARTARTGWSSLGW